LEHFKQEPSSGVQGAHVVGESSKKPTMQLHVEFATEMVSTRPSLQSLQLFARLKHCAHGS
jgi:hypothetical protein